MKFFAKDVYRRKVKSQPVNVKRTSKGHEAAAKKDIGPTPRVAVQSLENLEHLEGRASIGYQINKGRVPSLENLDVRETPG